MAVTALDFEWIVVDRSANEIDMKPRFRSFAFDHGANFSRLTPPRAFLSAGALNLNYDPSYFTYTLLEDFAHVIVRTAAHTYFNLEITDREIRDEEGYVRLSLAGRSSAAFNEGIEYVNRPTPSLAAPTAEQVITQYFPEAQYGRMWPVGVPGRYELVGSVAAPAIDFERQSLIKAFESAASCVFLERCDSDTPQLFVTRLPLDIDTLVSYIFREDNTDFVSAGYREGRTDKWQANRWEVSLAGGAWDVRPTKMANISINTTKNSSGTFVHWTDLNRLIPEFFNNNLDTEEWGGFLLNQVATGWTADPESSAPADFTITSIRVDSDPCMIRIGHPFRGTSYRVDFEFPDGMLEYYKTANVRPPIYQIFATEVNTESRRLLPRNRLSLRIDDTGVYQTINDILDAWAGWQAHWGNFAILPDALYEGEERSIPQKRPGDVVNLDVGGLYHRSMITRVGWQMEGIRDLSVTWNAITLGGLPSEYRLYRLTEDNPLFRIDDQGPLYREVS